jgi:hypothetical protein
MRSITSVVLAAAVLLAICARPAPAATYTVVSCKDRAGAPAPGGPTIYEMRARVRAADDYPYATGVSRRVRVRVR